MPSKWNRTGQKKAKEREQKKRKINVYLKKGKQYDKISQNNGCGR